MLPISSSRIDGKEAERIIKGNIGLNLFLSGFEESRKEQFFDFGVIKEQHLWDSQDGSFKVRFVPFNNVFRVTIEENKGANFLIVPNRPVIAERIDARLNGFRTSSEGALLKAMGKKILNLWQIRNQMNPLYEIASNAIMKSSVRSNDFVHGNRTKEKVDRYMTFLTGIGILKREDGGYVIEASAEKNLDEGVSLGDVYDAMLSESIQKGHAYMTEFLHFTHITPFIRLGNSNYLPSYIARKRLGMNDADLSEYQHNFYGIKPRPLSRVLARASQMVEIGVFAREKSMTKGSLFISNEDVYADYSEKWKNEASSFMTTS
jgi:hypothetical protein